jgi:hypothetical protein
VHQVIFGREAIDETALADAGTRGDGIERETSATGLKNHGLGGIQNPIPIDLFFPRQNRPRRVCS